MTDDADLRARLARIDPARRSEAVDLVEATTAQDIRERAMQTIDTPTPVATRRPRPWLFAAGAAASVAAVAAAALAFAGGDASTPKRETPVTTLTLTAPSSLTAGSCVMFDVAILRDMPIAFAGTVTALDGANVTLDVDRWYKGGTADRVTVASPESGMPVAIEGVEFKQGERYLVAAADGSVNGCGFSGPATAELEKAYGEAFAG